MTSESNTTETKPLAEMSRDELRKVAAELKIAGRGTMLKPALIEAIAHERAARIKANVDARKVVVIEDAKSMDVSALQPIAVYAEEADETLTDVMPYIESIDLRPESPSEIMSDIRERAYATPTVRRGERGMVDGRPMPTHCRGRAMGAKHYPSRPAKKLGGPGARPVGHDDREDVYRDQLGGFRRGYNLTPKQERRLTHKANHHSAVMADPR